MEEYKGVGLDWRRCLAKDEILEDDMQKIKTFFFLAAAIAITATFAGGAALAAEVTKVDGNKGHVYIDQGKDAGFIFGAEVCFYSFTEEEITCGNVRQTSATYAMVEVNNRLAKLIKKGMKAALKTVKSK